MPIRRDHHLHGLQLRLLLRLRRCAADKKHKLANQPRANDCSHMTMQARPTYACHSAHIKANNASGTGREMLQPISHIPSMCTQQHRNHFCGEGYRVTPDLCVGPSAAPRAARLSSSSSRPDPLPASPPLPPVPPTALSALELHGCESDFDARAGAHLADASGFVPSLWAELSRSCSMMRHWPGPDRGLAC
jgi:hypothetical protein